MKKYIKKAKFEFVASNILAVVNVICVSYYPYLLSYIIDHFEILEQKSLIFILASFVFSVALILLVSYLNKIAKASYRRKICTSIRRDVFRNVSRFCYSKFHSHNSEAYTSFLINDVEQLYTQYYENLIYLTNTILMLAAYTIILAFVSWQMCLVIMGSLLPILFIPQLVGKRFHKLNTALSSSKASYLSRCEEILAAHDITDSNAQPRICRLHDKQLENMQEKEFSLEKYRSFLQVISGSALYVQLIFCFIIGLILSYMEIIPIGIFASSLLYVEYVSQQSSNIVDEFLEIRSSKTYRDKCQAFLSDTNAKSCINPHSFTTLRLEEVSYQIDGTPLIENVNFEFIRGKKYLICGSNGSGKSTLLKLLAGYLSPTTGKVLWGSDDQCNSDDIGFVPQQRLLFEGSLEDNITLFCGTLSPEDASRISAMCTTLHLKYPLNHRITRNGGNLSGGEIAKICLIREIFQDKGLLLIDEPLNDIDVESQKDILNFLLNLDKTMIMVAHGLSEEERFDQVLHIRNGSLIAAK